MLRRFASVLLCMATLAWTAGCSGPASPDPQSEATSATISFTKTRTIDGDLYDLLLSQSGGEGLAYFRLPDEGDLASIPQDPLNPLTREKVRLGRMLYHETALGVDNVLPSGAETYSCASCHHAQGGFMANLPQGMGEGGSGFGAAGESRTFMPAYDSDPHTPDCQPIRTPTAMNTAYQELMLWNGQFGGVGDNLGTEDRWTEGTPLESNRLGLHGLETQAHAGLVVHRMGHIELSRIGAIPHYRSLFRRAFRTTVRPSTASTPPWPSPPPSARSWPTRRRFSSGCAGKTRR